jgi:predicted nucleic acid-binding protein
MTRGRIGPSRKSSGTRLSLSHLESLSVIRVDPSDDRVLEAAVAGQVSAIVSGDRHLLRLKRWRDIRIMTPAEFVAEFE